MKLEIEAVLTDYHGGDGIVRPMEVTTTKLERQKTTKRTRRDIGAPSDTSVREQKFETKSEPVHTFRKDKDGTPLARLGGPYGKIYGAIREADKYLRGFEDGGKLKLPMAYIRITPTLVRLEDAVFEKEPMTIPQMMNTMGNSMIAQYYDVIREARVKFSIEFPDSVQDRIERILGVLEGMGIGPKRRGVISAIRTKEA